MGVEDFAYYAQKVPGGHVPPGRPPARPERLPAPAQPAFNFNDDALPVGIRMFCEVTRRFLSGQR